VDGEAILEEIEIANKLETTEMDLFVGLYQIDLATDLDDAYMDNESDTDADEPKGEHGLGGQHGDRYHCQPPTICRERYSRPPVSATNP